MLHAVFNFACAGMLSVQFSSVAQLCLTLCDPTDCIPPGSSVPAIFPGKITGVCYHFLLQGNLPNPGIKLASPALVVGFFITESPGESHSIL